ncbi:MAG TPA: hypothetical protein VFP91_22540 [Vicinamibacterales bacterium]|nr:hypothetical protein [Vicinamibacterales bacterium]
MKTPILLAALTLAFAAIALNPTPVVAQEREGIQVRGRWVVEVRDPDGTLVKRLEFDNALAPGGAQLLAQYLTGSSAARWVVELGTYGGSINPCNGGTNGNFTQNSCLIVDGASVPLPNGTSIFPTLTAALGGSASDQVVLTGTATALVAGQIDYVATREGSCGTFTAPANCNPAGTVLQFTVHDLVNAQGQPAGLQIGAGQIVRVTVNLSFS